MGRVRSERVALWLQMIVVFLALTTMSGTRPTTTYRALSLGASTFDVGLVQSAYSVLPALTAVFVGRWVDRFGEVVIYAIALSVLAFGSLVSGLAGSLLVLASGQALIGFGTVAMLIASQAMIANRSRPESWSRNYGTYSAFLSLGQLVGPTAAAQIMATPGLDATSPERPAFYALGAVSLLGAGLILLLPRTRPAGSGSDGGGASRDGALAQAESVRVVVGRILRRPGMLGAIFIGVAVLSAIDITLAYLPVLGDVKGLSVQLVGILLSLRAGTTLVSRLFMDRLLRRLGWVPLLVGSLAIAAVTILVLPAFDTPALLLILIGVFGLGLGFGQPMAVTWVASSSPKSDRATALGLRLTANRVSLMFAPAAMGLVAGSAGVAAVFWILGGVLGLAAAVAAGAKLDAEVARQDQRAEAAGSAPSRA